MIEKSPIHCSSGKRERERERERERGLFTTVMEYTIKLRLQTKVHWYNTHKAGLANSSYSFR